MPPHRTNQAGARVPPHRVRHGGRSVLHFCFVWYLFFCLLIYSFVCSSLLSRTVEERMVARAQKKMFLDTVVTGGGGASAANSEDAQAELLSTLTFGVDRIFQKGSAGANERYLCTVTCHANLAHNLTRSP